MSIHFYKLIIVVTLFVLWGCDGVVPTDESKDAIRIVVVSDTHLMAKELLIHDGTAFQDYLASSKKLVDYSQVLLDQFVLNVMSMSPKPDLVLITGDLSKDGELVSHEYVKKKLDVLKQGGIPTLVVPGNHDWGKRSKAVCYDGETTTKATTCVRFGDNDNSLEKIYADYGFCSCYKNVQNETELLPIGVERESAQSTLTYACEPISGLVVIGIDTGRDAVISDATLDWVCVKSEAAVNAGKKVIAMMHYPLIPHISGSSHVLYPSKEADTGFGYETVRNRLADAGIRCILTGHYHNTDIAKDWNADLTRPIYDVLTGSLIVYPCSYRVLTFTDNMNTLSIATKRIVEAGNSLTGLAFSQEIAKSRLLQPGIQTEIVEGLVSAGLNDDAAAMAAPSITDAYVFHAEGNENENEKAQSLRTKLNGLLNSVPSYLDMMNSMLLDLSNMGDADRENTTNDLTLVLSL